MRARLWLFFFSFFGVTYAHAYPINPIVYGKDSVLFINEKNEICIYDFKTNATKCIDMFNGKEIKTLAIDASTAGHEKYFVLTIEGLFVFSSPFSTQSWQQPELTLQHLGPIADIQAQANVVMVLTADDRLGFVQTRKFPYITTIVQHGIKRFFLRADLRSMRLLLQFDTGVLRLLSSHHDPLTISVNKSEVTHFEWIEDQGQRQRYVVRNDNGNVFDIVYQSRADFSIVATTTNTRAIYRSSSQRLRITKDLCVSLCSYLNNFDECEIVDIGFPVIAARAFQYSAPRFLLISDQGQIFRLERSHFNLDLANGWQITELPFQIAQNHWTPQRHVAHASNFVHRQVKTFLLILYRLRENWALRVPRPLTYLIIAYFANSRTYSM